VSESRIPATIQAQARSSQDVGGRVALVAGAGIPLDAPVRVGAFEVMVELAAGGMATVFLARRVATDDPSPASSPSGSPPSRLYALKRPHRHLATDKVFLSMIIDEARLASVIDHPNVVKVRELGFEAGEPFVVMDYVEGASLSDLRKSLAPLGRALDTRVAVRIVLDALDGLHAAHETKDEDGRPLGIIHRDVSPHNVIVGMDGRSRLTDFGVAKAEDRVQTTRTHEVKGKLAYLAPERIDKRRICTVQSDLFSMAVVLWECIAGRRLFRGDEAIDTLQEVMNAPIPRLRKLGANVPEALDDVLARALSRDLDTRHRTAQELAIAIERAVGPRHIASREDVARIMDAVFGATMAARYHALRERYPAAEVGQWLSATGIPDRPQTEFSPLAIQESRLGSLAPPAPSERYIVEPVASATPARRTKPSRLLPTLLAIGTFLVFALGALLVFTRPQRGRPVASASAAIDGRARRVVVTLPRAATRVRLDDMDRTLQPAADVAVFEVPAASGVRHHLSAWLSDGSRIEATLVEADGVARTEPPGFVTVTPGASSSTPSAIAGPPSASADPPPPRPPSKPRPVGTTRNGFTKLK
jgi:serine/threonine-protein kinase